MFTIQYGWRYNSSRNIVDSSMTLILLMITFLLCFNCCSYFVMKNIDRESKILEYNKEYICSFFGEKNPSYLSTSVIRDFFKSEFTWKVDIKILYNTLRQLSWMRQPPYDLQSQYDFYINEVVRLIKLYKQINEKVCLRCWTSEKEIRKFKIKCNVYDKKYRFHLFTPNQSDEHTT